MRPLTQSTCLFVIHGGALPISSNVRSSRREKWMLSTRRIDSSMGVLVRPKSQEGDRGSQTIRMDRRFVAMSWMQRNMRGRNTEFGSMFSTEWVTLNSMCCRLLSPEGGDKPAQ